MSALSDARQIAEAAGGGAWIETLTIQGDTDGSVKGASVMIGWRALGIDGKWAPGKTGPFPVTIAQGEDGWQEVVNTINLSAIRQCEELTLRVADLEQQLAEGGAD